MTAPFTPHEAEIATHLSLLLDEYLGMVVIASDQYSPARQWLFDPWIVLEELRSGEGAEAVTHIEVALAASGEVDDPAEIADIWLTAIMDEPGPWWVPVTDDGAPEQYRLPREAL